MADLLHSMADHAISIADLAHSMAGPSGVRAGGGDFRGRRAIFPDDAARAAGAAVLWGWGGFPIPAAAALLPRTGEDGVPAVKGAPLRKTAKHQLAGVL